MRETENIVPYTKGNRGEQNIKRMTFGGGEFVKHS